MVVAEMISAYLAYQFAGIWPLLWYFGVGGVIVIGCLAAAWFSPVFKSHFLWAAAVMAAVMVTFTIGVFEGEKRIQAQWDQARANAVDSAKKARAGAVRDAARKPSRWLPARKDSYDSDRH